MLDKNSKKEKQPKNLNLELWEHQKAMLWKCKEIEKNKRIGVLTDDPGTGKSHVILSLISDDIQNEPNSKIRTNIIVVTENIYEQWTTYIKNFSNIKWTKFIEYSDISELYFQSHFIQNFDILLTTPLYYKVICDILKDNKIKIKRIIIDEIDSVETLIKSDLDSKFVWLISGTFDIEKIGYFSGKIISVVKCVKSFYKPLNNLKKPKIDNILCYDNNINIISDLLSFEELNEINACGQTCENTIENCLKNLKELKIKYNKQINEISHMIKKKNIEGDFLDEMKKKKKHLCGLYNISNNKLNKLVKRLKNKNICLVCFDEIKLHLIYISECCLNFYCKECLFESVKMSSKCPYCRTAIYIQENVNENSSKTENKKKIFKLISNPLFYSKIDKLKFKYNKIKFDINKLQEKQKLYKSSENMASFKNNKIEYIKKYFRETNIENKSIIIFSSYSSTFRKIQKILDNGNIGYVMLDGGNIELIQKQINLYKSGKKKILMANSNIHGCGINLENTTDVILIHYSNKFTSLEKQLISRAQRPGRLKQLHIIKLCYMNELENIKFAN